MIYTGTYIDKNWNKYRCKIYIAPFAGLVKPEKGKNFAEIGSKNIINCLWTQIKLFFKMLIKPFNYRLQTSNHTLSFFFTFFTFVYYISGAYLTCKSSFELNFLFKIV